MVAESETLLVHRHTESSYEDTKSKKSKMSNNHNNNNNNNNNETEVLSEYELKKSDITNSNNTNNISEIKTDKEIEAEIIRQVSSTATLEQIGTDYSFKREIVWFNAIGFLILHVFGAVGFGLLIFGYAKIQTFLFTVFLLFWSGMGVTAGAHRLFSHRAYKATPGLRLLLLLLHTMAGQNCLYVWVRDHRQHHKYSDTDADPHNANRGFFFSHIGWLMSKKHPKVIEYGKKIDMSDLEADYWIMFQKRYYKTLYTIFVLLIPTAIPIFCWGEHPVVSFLTQYLARTIIQLNFTWSVNSVAHIWGNKPYDKNMLPVETKYVAMVAGGEGWHNYHHTFPWDYRAAELNMPYNVTTSVIDWFAERGYVYDRKTVTNEMLKSRINRTGDGTHHAYGNEINNNIENTSNTIKSTKLNEQETTNGPSTETLRKYIVDKNEINKIQANGGSNVEIEKLSSKIDDLNNNNNLNNKYLSDSKFVRNFNSLNGKQALNVYN
ncbi:acyl-CoA Delta-9 desaturase-like [Condylostylus longicornis]|uniref:acyl-CoA Delta-9 desaturase-like n=1 Tax=Condylostylus longicornis TaxID=2530218 RepID=UPI00244E46A7|nr:acyl-CoA Delta-9 desaturase-like [Condylostylus longicornis]